MILLVQNSHSAGNRNREQEGNLETDSNSQPPKTVHRVGNLRT
jgi:hypothetical protein